MTLEISLLTIGRICLALYFIIGAFMDIRMRQETLQLMRSKKIPLTALLFVSAVSLKLLAGLGIIFHVLPVESSLALALFTLLANIIFNNFWAEEGIRKSFAAIRFLSNLAVVGGLLLVMAFYL